MHIKQKNEKRKKFLKSFPQMIYPKSIYENVLVSIILRFKSITIRTKQLKQSINSMNGTASINQEEIKKRVIFF